MAAEGIAERVMTGLRAYLDEPGEDALLEAYDIGRQALADGESVTEIVEAHQLALQRVLRDSPESDASALMQRAGPFLVECLSPFDMSQRSVLEANSILRRLNQMLEDEAGRIAHALHDEAGGILASARMELDLAVRDLPPEILDRVQQVRELLDQTGEQLRHLSHELRPMILDDLGLMPALQYLASGITTRNKLDVEVQGDLPERPPAAVELAIYRVVQEALNNVVRHADGATSVVVRISRHRDLLSCIIDDDGCGFDLATVMSDRSTTTMGLAGIRERIHAVGGSLEVHSLPGQGTRLTLKVPLLDVKKKLQT